MTTIKNLTESLEKKYRLYEAFDPSLPNWLKKELSRNRWLRDALLNAGIDISKLKAHEAPIPDKVPRNSKNQKIIPVFLMDNNEVWVKNYNDYDSYGYVDTGSWSTSGYKTFKQMNSQQIIERTKDYCYLEKADPAITDKPVEKKRFDRQKLQQELRQLGNYFRTAEENQRWQSASFDKSGYQTKDLKIKYRDELVKRHIKDVDSRYVKACEDAQTLTSVLQDLVEDADINDKDSFRNIRHATDTLIDIANYMGSMRDAMEGYNKVKDDPVALQNVAGVLISQLENLESRLKDAQESLSGFSKAVVDW